MANAATRSCHGYYSFHYSPPPPPPPPSNLSLPWSSISSRCPSPNYAFRTHKLSLIDYHQNPPLLLSHPPSALPFDLSPPIDHDLLDTVTVVGAKISEDGIIETFDNDDEALDAVENGVVGCDTVFVTPTARTIDIAHAWIMVNGMPITVAVGNIISEEGFSLLMSPAAAGSVWKTLLSRGAIPMGSKAWETFRVFQGRPAPGKELTNEYNVLEAGLWNAISLNKGCYKDKKPFLDSPITVGTKKVGNLTSYAAGRNKSEHFGLGYIKRRAASEGDTVIVGDNIVGTVVEVPYLARQCPPSKSSTS
ncbi:putative transferase [Camellia lanceoleosa]|uniref:Transferase n=1 Tax=Camellia lanceoleosa TaxID=1840588 RepID=A0ACC0IG23_9ERIC|nr:putative transferase [Camellia lanceoleosa]